MISCCIFEEVVLQKKFSWTRKEKEKKYLQKFLLHLQFKFAFEIVRAVYFSFCTHCAKTVSPLKEHFKKLISLLPNQFA